MEENTIILTLKLKVDKNNYKVFNLRKYDDLFKSFQNFVYINKIRKELVKPLLFKIIESINKIYSLLNNKIGSYDKEYLYSLYKLWIKNKTDIPYSKNILFNDKKSINIKYYSSKKLIKSNSFSNYDENSSDSENDLSVRSF